MAWNLDTIGIATFLIGLVPWTIGGMISLRTRYDVHNRWVRMALDPDGEPASVSQEELEEAHFKNPSSRWWCIIGSLLAIVGMGMLTVSMALNGNPAGIIAGVVLMYMAFRTYRAATER